MAMEFKIPPFWASTQDRNSGPFNGDPIGMDTRGAAVRHGLELIISEQSFTARRLGKHDAT